MARWEYLFVEFFYEEQVTKVNGVAEGEVFDQLIHQAGEEGWELVSMTETRASLLAVLKR
jgi:hypothetical protein